MEDDMATKDQQDITHALVGLEFPASRFDIFCNAEVNRAREKTMLVLERLPDGKYQDPGQVFQTLTHAD
jgi:hypothetical protein